MKFMKRAGIYQASNYNVTFDPKKIEARSYQWWSFVSVVEGKVIFNNYRYSVTTSKHQSKVRNLMSELGIKIDIEMPVPKGLQMQIDYATQKTLQDFILEAEELLCDQFLQAEEKKIERNEKAKQRRIALQASSAVPEDRAARIVELWQDQKQMVK